MNSSPTPLFKGSALGPTTIILSRPEIRSAQVITRKETFDTYDGLITGSPGDIAITAYGKERYPIKNKVFLGSYEILGRIDHDLIAERLVHVRYAWEVLDHGSTFDYGDGRGVVEIKRGGWLYQSDVEDFGTIHPDIKVKSHFLVGHKPEIIGSNWQTRSENMTNILSTIPPFLSLLALLAFASTSQLGQGNKISAAITLVETLILIVSAFFFWKMRHRRWLLRACVQKAIELGLEFKSAAELLGHTPSTDFPGMVLWRAAQSKRPESSTTSTPPEREKELLNDLHGAITNRLHKIKSEIKRIQTREEIASKATTLAFTAVLLANALLLLNHHGLLIEITVIWAPAAVAAIHTFDLRRRTAERVAIMQHFYDRLSFAQSRLRADNGETASTRTTILRLICTAAAQFSQRELKLAISLEPPLPI